MTAYTHTATNLLGYIPVLSLSVLRLEVNSIYVNFHEKPPCSQPIEAPVIHALPTSTHGKMDIIHNHIWMYSNTTPFLDTKTRAIQEKDNHSVSM